MCCVGYARGSLVRGSGCGVVLVCCGVAVVVPGWAVCWCGGGRGESGCGRARCLCGPRRPGLPRSLALPVRTSPRPRGVHGGGVVFPVGASVCVWGSLTSFLWGSPVCGLGCVVAARVGVVLCWVRARVAGEGQRVAFRWGWWRVALLCARPCVVVCSVLRPTTTTARTLPHAPFHPQRECCYLGAPTSCQGPECSCPFLLPSCCMLGLLSHPRRFVAPNNAGVGG